MVSNSPRFERPKAKANENTTQKRYYPEERYVPETYLPMERPRGQYDPYYDNYPVATPRPQIPSLRVRREATLVKDVETFNKNRGK